MNSDGASSGTMRAPPSAGGSSASSSGRKRLRLPTDWGTLREWSVQRRRLTQSQRTRLINAMALLKHCSRCEEAECKYSSACKAGKRLCTHISSCRKSRCEEAGCQILRAEIALRRLSIQRQRAAAAAAAAGNGGAGGSGVKLEGAGKRQRSGGRGGHGGPSKRPRTSKGGHRGSGGAADLPAHRHGVPRPMYEDSQAHHFPPASRVTLPPLDLAASHLFSLSRTQLTVHLQASRPRQVRDICRPVLDKIEAQDESRTFCQPVDPATCNAPGYFMVVRRPMDLSTIKRKLARCAYRTIAQFKDDVNLVWDNACAYVLFVC